MDEKMPSAITHHARDPHSNRLLVIILGATLLVLATPETAEACGRWSLVDVKRGRVKFLVSNVRLRGRLIFTIWGRSPNLRSVDTGGRQVKSPRSHKTLFKFRGNTLRYGGKRIGKLKGSTFTISNQRYEILLKPRGKRSWSVRVEHRGKMIAHAKMALSFQQLCGTVGVASAEAEVRRRIALYLAWRKIVYKKSARKK